MSHDPCARLMRKFRAYVFLENSGLGAKDVRMEEAYITEYSVEQPPSVVRGTWLLNFRPIFTNDLCDGDD